jgi:hypothetical protein
MMELYQTARDPCTGSRFNVCVSTRACAYACVRVCARARTRVRFECECE